MIQYHEPIPARRGWERKGRWFCKIEVATPVYVRNAPDCQQSKCKFCDDNPPSPWGGISCANHYCTVQHPNICGAVCVDYPQ